MSLDLKDLRCKIPAATACYLEAEARAQGIDKCQLVRDILKKWAESRHGAFIEAQRLLQSQGLIGASRGRSGNRGESQGKQLVWDDPE